MPQAVLVLVVALGAGCSASGSPAAAPTLTAKPTPSATYTLAPKPTVTLPPGAPRPTKVPRSSGLVTIPHGASVQELEHGRSRICVGAQDLMPGAPCSGIDLIGFNWSEFPEAATNRDGLRYGSFDVVGRYDGKKLTVVLATVHRNSGSPVRHQVRRRTPCAPPVGGWRVVDPNTKHAPGPAVAQVYYVARGLPGFAGFWLVHLGRTPDNQVRVVLNVAVTGDKARAERALREVWGGALCVSSAKHSVAALSGIANRVVRLPGVTSAYGDFDRVLVDVIYDDGSLQAWLNQNYPQGLVVVRSLLKPVTG